MTAMVVVVVVVVVGVVIRILIMVMVMPVYIGQPAQRIQQGQRLYHAVLPVTEEALIRYQHFPSCLTD